MSGPLRILHVVAGLEPHHGGPSYSVPRLARAQAEQGAEVTLATVAGNGAPPAEGMHHSYRAIEAHWDGARVPLVRKLRLSSGLDSALAAVAPLVDVVHNHGLWLWPNVSAARAARRAGRPFILAPRGMLAPEALAFSRWQKEFFWRLLQGPALRGLACIHATSVQERDEVRAFGLTAPVALVPNGIDIPALECPRPVPPGEAREALYLGRLHPKKSIDMLVEAWARLAPQRRAGWRLRIVGPSEDGHAAALSAQAARLHLSTEVSIEPPLYGPEKLAAYRRASVFVLPTRNENFGLTVAEALAAETPVISTRGAPWAGLEKEGCGWWTAYGVEPMAAALEAALGLPDAERHAMGVRGRDWMARDFSWSTVAEQLIEVAAWLKSGRRGEPPTAILPD